MIPITIEGKNLGEIHKQLNAITNTAFENKVPFENVRDLEEKSHLDRLFKIDLANKYRNLEYIFENIKCDDSLYVTRALKSTWLFTDNAYSDIINPNHFYEELYPELPRKSFFKLKQAIRQHLKCENRCEEFYNYSIELGDVDEAHKYLPKCSVDFIKSKLSEGTFPENLLNVLARRSVDLVQVMLDKAVEDRMDHQILDYLKKFQFLASSDPSRYMDFLEKYKSIGRRFHFAQLSYRNSQALIRSSKERVLGNRKLYLKILNLDAVGSEMSQEEVQKLLTDLCTDCEMNDWFTFKNIKPLIKRLPKEGCFKFLREIFNKRNQTKPQAQQFMEAKRYPLRGGGRGGKMKLMKRCAKMAVKVNVSKAYDWYRYADFRTAFAELKEMIRTESSADERVAMLRILVTTTHKSPANILALLEYFQNNHINEPKHIKLSFLRYVVKHLETHKFNDQCWKVLNELFYCVEAYEDNEDSDCQKFLEVIVIYHITHDLDVPDKIMDICFKSLPDFKESSEKLNADDKAKVFDLIISNWKKNIEKLSIESVDEFNKMSRHVYDVMRLFDMWKKSLVDYPEIIKLCKEMIYKQCQNSQYEFSTYWYEKQSSEVKRLFFNEMLLMDREEKVYLYMLKHDPSMIERNMQAFDKLLKEDNVKFKRFYTKLSVYFQSGLGVKWQDRFQKKLELCNTDSSGVKNVVYGLCLLTNRDLFTNTLNRYTPVAPKIVWSQENTHVLNIRKELAKKLYVVKPSLGIDPMLNFGKGDYLQYVLPSLSALCLQLPLEEYKNILPKILVHKVSLQKLALNCSYLKLTSTDMFPIFKDLWKSKNKSIRALTLKCAFSLLCPPNIDDKIRSELLDLLREMVENLSNEEGKILLTLASKIDELPEPLRPDLCTIVYIFLRKTPEILNRPEILEFLEYNILQCMDKIGNDVLAEIVQKQIDVFLKDKGILKEDEQKQGSLDVFPKYFLKCEEDISRIRYATSMGQISKLCKYMWNEVKNDAYIVRNTFSNLLKKIIKECANTIIKKDRKYIKTAFTVINLLVPTIAKLYPKDQYYNQNITSSLLKSFFDSVQFVLSEKTKLNPTDLDKDYEFTVLKETGPIFAEKCIIILKEELKENPEHLKYIFFNIIDTFISQYLQLENGLPGFILKYSMSNHFMADPKDEMKMILGVKFLISLPESEYYFKYFDVRTMHKSIRSSDALTPEIKFLYNCHVDNYKAYKNIDKVKDIDQ